MEQKEYTPDDKDLIILEMLQEDSSQPITKIARADGVKLSAPSVHERIRKMKECGIIKKYTVLLDEKKLSKDVIAFIEITLDFKAHEPDVSVPSEVANIKGVLEVFNLAGDADHLVKVKTDNITTLEDIIRTINRLPGVGRTRSIIVLSTEKEETALSLT